MSAIRLLDFVILTVLLFLCVLILPAVWDMIRIYVGIRSRRLEDATSFAPQPAKPVADLIATLKLSGFSRIGERSTVLPGNRRRFEWDLVDGLTTTYIALVPADKVRGGVLLACYSAFDDGTFVATYYPRGPEIHQPGLDVVAQGNSPAETVDAHYARIEAFAVVRGRPLENRSMADLLERDVTYRKLHGGATLRGRVLRHVALAAILLVATAADVLRIVVVDR